MLTNPIQLFANQNSNIMKENIQSKRRKKRNEKIKYVVPLIADQLLDNDIVMTSSL
jgi:hypothetical protein